MAFIVVCSFLFCLPYFAVFQRYLLNEGHNHSPVKLKLIRMSHNDILN